MQVLKNAGKQHGDVILVGFDALPDEVKGVTAEWETASVAQFPAKIGLLGIDRPYKAVKGKKVATNVDTGTALVTKANARAVRRARPHVEPGGAALRAAGLSPVVTSGAGRRRSSVASGSMSSAACGGRTIEPLPRSDVPCAR